MKLLVKNGRVVDPANELDAVRDILIEDGVIHSVAKKILDEADETINASGKIVTPGWIDMHVHFREPGFEHKEDIASGSRAAAAGGVTTVVAMPNLNPVPDSPQALKHVLDIATRKSVVNYFQTASITYGENGTEVTDFSSLSDAGAIAFTDDGKPVADGNVMLAAMRKARENGVLLSLHEEEEAALVKRDLQFLEQLPMRLHFQHLSLHGSIEAVRQAKAAGKLVTCETAPHYFSLTAEDVEKKGANAKMNPPLRTKDDREAVKRALKDGTIDAIITDHAPHSPEEKAKPLSEAPCGVIGLETMVGVCVNELIHGGVLEWSELVAKVTCNPAKILGLHAGNLTPGMPADLTVIDHNAEWTVDSSEFESKARNCPWDGEKLKGKPFATIVSGEIVMLNGKVI